MSAHGGGSFPGTIGRIEHGFLCRPDLVAVDNPVNPRDYCGHFYVDSLTHDEEALLHCSRLFSPQRILLGSDYPFPLGEARPGQLITQTAQLSEEEKAAMLWDNAVAFLGVEKREHTLHGARKANGAREEGEADAAAGVEEEQRRRREQADEAEVERIQQQLERFHAAQPADAAAADHTAAHTSDQL